MQFIDCIVCIGVTERKGNIRMDIYWEWAGDMKKKTVRYRKEEAALCDAALSGLLGRGIGGPECVKGGVKPSPFLEGKDGLYRCLSGTCKNRVFPGQRQPSLFCEKAVCGRSAGSCQESIKRQSEKERPVCLRRRHKTARTGSKAAAAQTDYADVLLNTEHAEAGSVSY